MFMTILFIIGPKYKLSTIVIFFKVNGLKCGKFIHKDVNWHGLLHF